MGENRVGGESKLGELVGEEACCLNNKCKFNSTHIVASRIKSINGEKENA
jgi:hypothetical protein